MRFGLILSAILIVPAAAAQPVDSLASDKPGIQDNSFLVEEAYNQEAGVVQHISTFEKRRGSNDFDFAFTQEWPFGSIVHQLSYDVPISRIGSRTGIGDVSLNYRYQLIGDGSSQLAVAPRLSLVLPTGDWKKGFGTGGLGMEVNLPVSYVISPLFASHSNIGALVIPSPKSEIGNSEAFWEWTAAQSLIVTASSRIQPMLEAVYSNGTETSFVVAPGLRSAINFPSGLQIVPGFSIPIGIGPSDGERGFFFYLSFEHPFKRQR